MDAKPQRLGRARTFRDENQPPTVPDPQGKTVHSRNKSSPALSTLAAAQGLKLGSRRAAFADVSNTSKPLVKDDSALSQKPALGSSKEAALQKPAQRPLSVSSIKGFFNNIGSGGLSKQPTVEEKEEVPEQHLPVSKPLSRKSTVIFKENAAQPAAPAHSLPKLPSVDPSPPPAVYTGNDGQQLRKKQSIYVDTHENIPNHEQLPQIPTSHDVQPPGSSSSEYFDIRSDNAPLHPAYIASADAVEHPLSAEVAYLDALVDGPIRPTALRPASTQAPEISGEHHSSNNIASTTTAMLRDPLSERWIEEAYAEYEDDYTTARSLKSRGETTTGPTTIVLNPDITSVTKDELAAAKKAVEASPEAVELEDEEQWDTSMVAEYSEEIFEYMRGLEEQMRPNPYYMDTQTEVQWSMRSVLMDWLVQVHGRFSLLPETLFLTVNFVDRFLSCKVVSLAKLQLVGATAIFVASKYEEINCPSVSEICYMVDNGYTIDEILKAERFMLSMLQFELGWPGPMSFLRRISKADDYDLETRTLAKYFLEITIMDERFVGCIPSYTAAGAHCLARLMLKKGEWSQRHVYYSGYTYSQLRPLLAAVISCCEDAQKHHAAVYDKYADKRFKRASYFVQNEMDRGFILPSVGHAPLISYPDSHYKW